MLLLYMSMPHSEVKECENHQSWRDLIIGSAVMYAIIATGGKQYKVSEGDVIKVEKLDAEVGAKVTFDNVLLVGGDTVKVGTPTVDGAKVEASVVSEGKGKKVIVYKYKRKTGYHKKNGHRQLFTQVKIDSIVG